MKYQQKKIELFTEKYKFRRKIFVCYYYEKINNKEKAIQEGIKEGKTRYIVLKEHTAFMVDDSGIWEVNGKIKKRISR